MDISELRRLVRQGEHLQLEFKRKANHPDKIAREIVAFANTEGGYLLVGVDDDGQIYGTKSAEGDAYEVSQYLEKNCYPKINCDIIHVPVNARREVLVMKIAPSNHKPHFIRVENGIKSKIAFVRVADMSITASREMVSILRHSRMRKGVQLHIGDQERTLLQYVEEVSQMSLEAAQRRLQISKRKTSTLLILMVRAGLLKIHPTERGDFYTLAEEAFQ